MPGYREITLPSEARAPRGKVPARGAVPGGWRAALAGAAGAAAAACRNSPGTVLGIAVAAGAAALVCVNALGHQSGHHPAPILPKVAAQKAPPPGGGAAEVPRETRRDAQGDPPRPAPAPRQAARDPIRDLIRADETTASVTPRPEPAKPSKAAKPEQGAKPERSVEAVKAGEPVLRAQRALAKLGYAVKPDGAMGPGTRAAIEKFERGADLPVTGEAAGRTLRALVSRAGQG